MKHLGILLLIVLFLGCGEKPVSYRESIQPILNAHCVRCHGSEEAYGKIVLTSYKDFMKSRTISGKQPLVTAGDLQESRLYVLCATSQAHFRMPPDTSSVTPLPEEELKLLARWIMQGAKDN
jgi:uncharacterized membrane protein